MNPMESVDEGTDPPQIWRTPAESSDYRTTPDYDETFGFLFRIADRHPETVRIEEFGRSGEGRALRLVVASGDGEFDPERIHASGRAILLVQNAIHAGETDGKDACLALLRDIVRDGRWRRLLDRVAFVFIPIYNVDGHERRSRFNRINQNGPEVAGWRANGTNLNLNRDYMKADAPETRAFFRMFHRWMPDLFVDDHVTDGTDFQYDVTFLMGTAPDVYPPTAEWIRDVVTPELVRRVNASGHLAFPSTIFLRDDTDPGQGLAFNENPPRFSTGRVNLENRPALLVEMHMLKDYRTRVTGNYELLRALLEVMNREASTLIALNREADLDAARLGTESSRGTRFPLVIEGSPESVPVPYRGRRFTRFSSEVSGSMAVRYDPEPWDVDIPMDPGGKVGVSVAPPAGYIVPPQWVPAIEVLELQGVTVHRTSRPWTGTVERYRLGGMQRPSQPFEGRFPFLRGSNVEREFGRFGTCSLRTETTSFPANSAVVPLTQRLSKVAVHWLEPEAPDSAVRWGFFDSIFEQKESGEGYVLERLARDELAKNPALAAEFGRRVQADPAFAATPGARLGFFYDRSEWGAANRVGEYPVGRLPTLEGVPFRA